jgi:beta-glucosidase
VLEKLTKLIVYKSILGELRVPHPATSMVDRTVEDADFQGREDRQRPATERAEQILQEMTLEEKVDFVGGYKQLGIRSIPRLGIPSIWCSDATSGLRSFPGGTAFLSGIAMAATWDPELVEQVAGAIAEQFRARGVSILLGPGVNIYRVPTCGRNFEYMGEDPYLAGKMAAAYIRGAQSQGVLTTVKHFAANNSEYDRHKTDSVLDERTLREIYLPAFRMAVQEGRTWGVMSSYNPVNGVYASENSYLLKKILREEWGFEGFVISDWNSVYSTAQAIKNGLNLEFPSGKWINRTTVSAALESGEINVDDINHMVRPLLRSLLSAGVYDRPQIDPSAKINSPEQIAIAKRAASSAVVLLKNEDNLLPLNSQTVHRIVVMGRTAVRTPTGGGGSSYVHRPNSIDLLTGVREEFDRSHIEYIPFRRQKLTKPQVEIIKSADVVIMGVGFKSLEESESYDRSWHLPEQQSDLIRRVAELNQRIIVVLTAGGGVETESWVHKIPAFVHTFYLGEFTGEIIARVLSGAVNPGGKLPFTMAKNWEDFASTAHYVKDYDKARFRNIFFGQGNPKVRTVWKMPYKEGLNVGYRHFDSAQIEPQFAFGHGLSYTAFEISDLKIKRNGGLPEITISVKNKGQRSGSEVIQCYVRDVVSSVYRPEKELKAFKKVFLAPGETKQIKFSLPIEAFQFYSETAKKWLIEPGEFEILIGTSSREIFASLIVEL